MAHYNRRGKLKSGDDDDNNNNLKVCATTGDEDSFISPHDRALHADMDDHDHESDLEMEENIDDDVWSGRHGIVAPKRLPVEPDDNAVDGLSEGFASLPVCTSTPNTVRCQSRLVDSRLAFLSPLEEDSGLGTSVPSFSSPFPCSSSSSSALSSTTPSSSCAESLVSCCVFSGLCSGGRGCHQTRSDHCLRSLSPLVLDTPPPGVSGLGSHSLMTVSGSGAGGPHSGVMGAGRGISSTPLSLSMSALFRHVQAPMASTPIDGDSPIAGYPPSLTATTTAATATAAAVDDALFHDYRLPRSVTGSIPPPPLWDSPLSQPPLRGEGEEEEEVSQDEAYFSSSSRLSMAASSPSGMEEDSNHSLGPLQNMMKRVLVQFTPSVPDRLVGRLVGLEHVDIIQELHWRSLPAQGVLAWLRPYLQPADCIRMCGVSQQWRRICLQDKLVNHYRRLCGRIHSRPEEKENWVKLKGSSGGAVRGLTRASGFLGDVQVTVPSPPIKHILSSPDLYEKARKSLRWEELLRHCPLCRNVARVESGAERARCQNHTCAFHFCTRCLLPPHPDRPCPAPRPPSPREPPSGRKSKKQLKRICNL